MNACPPLIEISAKEKMIWEAALELARAGDRSLLLSRLRESKTSPPRAVLDGIADFIEGKIQWSRKRGASSRARKNAVEIRNQFNILTSDVFRASQSPKFKKTIATNKLVHEFLANVHNVSAETIRDVVERRHTFREK